MKNKILLTFVFLLGINLTAGYAQDIVCRGIIIDAETNLPLQDVRFCPSNNLNNIIALSSENGEFQLPPLKAGSKLILKKSSYAWYVLRVKNNDLQQVKLVPSNPEYSPYRINGKTVTENDLEIYFDEQLVPKAEWGDAMSVDSNEIEKPNYIVRYKGLATFRYWTK